MSSIERREIIRKWLVEYDKYIVKDRDDVEGENFEFSFFIWGKSSSKIIPLLIGYLREPKDLLLIGWGWQLDKSHDVVKDVINDPVKTSKFVETLKMAIDSKKYRTKFLPDEKNLDSIQANCIYRFDWMTKERLEEQILQVWLQFGYVLLAMEQVSGRPFVPRNV